MLQNLKSVVLLNKKHIYSYLKCIVYDKLLKPRQSFRKTLHIYERMFGLVCVRVFPRLRVCVLQGRMLVSNKEKSFSNISEPYHVALAVWICVREMPVSSFAELSAVVTFCDFLQEVHANFRMVPSSDHS